jgi:hypothetical protein
LILGRCSYISFYRQMSQKFFYFSSTHFLRMALIVKYNVALYPTNVAFLCFIRIMEDTWITLFAMKKAKTIES